ncbi:MAG TPA: dihydroorotate dehydrogenase-like protein [Acidimicrobiia bacterium]|nr:dihydroorotate dehydrogenase-like protein [Acidimicrobiia bacterium]
MSVDLSTTYLGLDLPHPVVPSASPVTGDLDHLHRLAAAGAAAVVLPSLFEEQVEHDAMALHTGLEFGAGAFAEAAGGYFPDPGEYRTGPGEYLDLVRRARAELQIPVIASLNGTTPGGWVLYARLLADLGIDALELNIYFIAADPSIDSQHIENRYLRLIEAVRAAVDIPLAVKVGPYFSSFGHMARRMVGAGANGLVLFNRFYQPDLDLEQMAVVPNLVLSTPVELRLVLRWMAILRGRIDCSLAATTGVHSWEEAAKLVLVGADVTMMASGLLRHGPGLITDTVEGLRSWLEVGGYQSLQQAKGSMSQSAVRDPSAFERANYMRALVSYSPTW